MGLGDGRHPHCPLPGLRFAYPVHHYGFKDKFMEVKDDSDVHAIQCGACGQAYEIYQKDTDSDIWYFVPRQIQ